MSANAPLHRVNSCRTLKHLALLAALAAAFGASSACAKEGADAKTPPSKAKLKAETSPTTAPATRPSAKGGPSAFGKAIKAAVQPTPAKTPAAPAPEEEGSFVGRPMKEILMTPIEGGKPVSTLALKGKPYILDIWATWCPPCRISLPYLQKLQELGAAQGLTVYCLSDEPEAVVRKFLDTFPYKLRFLIDTSGAVMRHYEIEGIPTTFAVDAEGIIRRIDVGFGGPAGLEKLAASVGVNVNLPGNLGPKAPKRP